MPEVKKSVEPKPKISNKDASLQSITNILR